MTLYSSFTECYYDLIDSVYNRYEYECSPRDMKIREVLGASFAISNPRDRLLFIPEREYSLTYAIAELLWYIMGDNKTDWIVNYSAFWKDISDDGKTANSAYGARIFKHHPYHNAVELSPENFELQHVIPTTFTQWDYVKNELTRDPDSRRAVIHIRQPQDSFLAKKDVPCTLTLQFFIRDGALHLLTNMRSTDLIFGLSYDVPAFTFFQELLAFELGIPVGTYMHVSNSLHVYERHFEMCEKIIEGVVKLEYPPVAMPAIPCACPTEVLNEIQWAARNCADEKSLVNVYRTLGREDLVHDYWRDWAKILVSHRARKLKLTALADEMVKATTFEGYHRFSK